MIRALLPLAVVPAGLCAAILTVATLAVAHEGDSPLDAWYRSLRSPDGALCCSTHDCLPVDARLKGDGWEVSTPNGWLAVPPEAILEHDNLDGRPIACMTPTGFVRCFVPPARS